MFLPRGPLRPATLRRRKENRWVSLWAHSVNCTGKTSAKVSTNLPPALAALLLLAALVFYRRRRRARQDLVQLPDEKSLPEPPGYPFVVPPRTLPSVKVTAAPPAAHPGDGRLYTGKHLSQGFYAPMSSADKNDPMESSGAGNLMPPAPERPYTNMKQFQLFPAAGPAPPPPPPPPPPVMRVEEARKAACTLRGRWWTSIACRRGTRRLPSHRGVRLLSREKGVGIGFVSSTGTAEVSGVLPTTPASCITSTSRRGSLGGTTLQMNE